jgi:hypothetical protein
MIAQVAWKHGASMDSAWSRTAPGSMIAQVTWKHRLDGFVGCEDGAWFDALTVHVEHHVLRRVPRHHATHAQRVHDHGVDEAVSVREAGADHVEHLALRSGRRHEASRLPRHDIFDGCDASRKATTSPSASTSATSSARWTRCGVGGVGPARHRVRRTVRRWALFQSLQLPVPDVTVVLA